MKVGVLDYGVGNLGSVVQALQELRVATTLITRAMDMHGMDSLILPGVGNFADCAKVLEEGGWFAALREEVQGAGKPLLGVCVGMQLLADYSTEGTAPGSNVHPAGLGFVPGHVENLRAQGCDLRVPHVGWNAVTPQTSRGGLFHRIPAGTDFYFVHSYAFLPADAADVAATAEYGVRFTAAVRRGKVWGTQFHPEKSSRAGFQLLSNFIESPEC